MTWVFEKSTRSFKVNYNKVVELFFAFIPTQKVIHGFFKRDFCVGTFRESIFHVGIFHDSFPFSLFRQVWFFVFVVVGTA
jgi:hypothetical protein